MAHQTSVSSRATSLGGNTASSQRSGIGGVIHDVSELAELQYHLLRLDLRQAIGAIAAPTAMVMVAMVGLLSCMTVFLLGLARLIDAFVIVPDGVIELIVGGLGIIVAAIIAAWTARRYRRAARAFQRSETELLRNLAWLRETTATHTHNGARSRNL